MSKIVIELTADEARTVSRGLFRAYDDIVGPFIKEREYATRACAKYGTSPDAELANLQNVEARVDAALKQAGERGATERVPVNPNLMEDLTGSAH